MTRLVWVVLAAALLVLQGCTLERVNKAPPPTASQKSWPAAPKGWHQTGTVTVDGQVVPVYSEDYQGEGQSGQMALNPATGRIQRFTYDNVGNVIWKRDSMEP